MSDEPKTQEQIDADAAAKAQAFKDSEVIRVTAVWNEHNAPLVEGVSAPNADPKQQCQCVDCAAARA